MRYQVDETMDEYLKSERIDKLRAPSRVNDSVQPSKATVGVLMRWAGVIKQDERP
jgi:hypothetical protein